MKTKGLQIGGSESSEQIRAKEPMRSNDEERGRPTGATHTMRTQGNFNGRGKAVTISTDREEDVRRCGRR